MKNIKYPSRYYFILLSVLFVTGILLLPDGTWNFAPIVYMFLGPVLLGILAFIAKFKLDRHIRIHHEDLVTKYALHYGAFKGKAINVFDLLHNKQEFMAKQDHRLNTLLAAFTQNMKLLLYSFLVLIVVAAAGIILR